jgi:His-Xaa-Ser system protein HxsD
MDQVKAGSQIAFSGPEGLTVVFDSVVYRLEAIKKASYKFGDRFHIVIQTKDSGRVEVVLKAKSAVEDAERLAGEFCNEVLDQELREVVAGETEGLRNLLLAHAFSRTSLVGVEFDTADYHTDPHHILEDARRIKGQPVTPTPAGIPQSPH